MVGIVAVAHNRRIAEGVNELASELVPREVPIRAIGGDSEGRMGTDIDQIVETVENLYELTDGILILGDIGSSLTNAREALKLLELEGYGNIAVSTAPLVEGVMVGAIESNLGKKLETIKSKIESKRIIDSW
ncbi:MAG: dihydroxyacetone kinase phosphoryl donor subunit DhaM [Bacillota bacterium]